MDILFILNPVAGVNRNYLPVLEGLSLLSRAGHRLLLRTTTKSGDATAFVLEQGALVDWIVCCGGDGTLNETLSGLMQLPDHKPRLSYLPRGSTNDFATTMSISQDAVAAVRSMLCHEPRPLDVGLWNGRSFVYVACFGAFTKSSYTASQSIKNVLGHFAYLLQGARDIASLRPYRVNIVADGETINGEYLFGAVCNSTSIGGVMKLGHDVVAMDDGLFELLLIPSPQSLVQLQALIVALLSQQYDSPYLVFRKVHTVVLETQELLPWALDGEFAPSHQRVEIVNHHHGVDMVL